MIPDWLPSVATALILGLAGNWISIIVTIRLNAQAMADHNRRIDRLEEDKLDTKIHDLEVRRLDAADTVALAEIARERHRLNNIEQRGAKVTGA